MESPYRIKTVPCENGERFPLMVNRNDGMPLYYPCLYLTTTVRGAGRQDKTLKKHSQAIKFVYEWALKNNMDLEGRFNAGEFLTLNEIDELTGDIYTRADELLAEYASETDELKTIRRGKVINLEKVRMQSSRKRSPIVKSHTAGIRFIYIRNYLDWLASRKLSRVDRRSADYATLSAVRSEMCGLINAKLSNSREQSDLNAIMGMEKQTESRLLQIIAVDSPDNPWRDERAKVRNQLLVYMLLFLGIRKGEALGLRVADINLSKNTVTIHRTPDDKTDRRQDQPQTKTKGRELSMNEALSGMCHEYITKYRSRNLPAARRTQFFFVGTRSGIELAISSVDDVFNLLKEKFPEFREKISPHIMRHTWNDRFSEMSDKKIRNGEWTVDDEKSARCAQMGWKINSKMAQLYAKRFIIEQANKAALELQNSIMNYKEEK